MGLRFGIDIGGTNTKFGVYRDFKLVDSCSFETDLDSLKYEIQREIKRHGRPEFIGLSFAGQVQDNMITSTQYVKGSEILNIDINSWSIEKFGAPALIDNDLNCAAIAEYATLKVKNLAVLYIGTGFGSAFISDGKIVRGGKNLGGELGHIPYKHAPFLCPCGGDKCLELYVSGSGIRRWQEFLGTKIKDLRSFERDPLLKDFYHDFLGGFAHGLLTVNALFNPERIVLGGGVIRGNLWLLEYANRVLLERGFSPSRAELAQLSTLDEFSGTLGAVSLYEG